MANKPLKSIKFPGLTDTYTIPQIDTSLTVGGKAADAQAVGNKFTEVTATAGKAYPTDTASGAVATFADGADDIPVKSCVVSIEPVQSGSGDPSPDNVRPISVWTGAQVSHSGADRTNPTTYSITFPPEAGTVYGGTLDVTNGVLTVDRAMVDLGTLNWRYTANYNGRFYVDLPVDAKPLIGVTGSICSRYAPTEAEDWQRELNYEYILRKELSAVGRCAIAIRDDDYTDAATFKTAMDGVQLVYELATPVTHQLTPTEIKSLFGDNNVWADCGDTSIEYRADTKLYIDKKIAEVINALS